MHDSSLWVTVEESHCKIDIIPKIDNKCLGAKQNNIKIIYDCVEK